MSTSLNDLRTKDVSVLFSGFIVDDITFEKVASKDSNPQYAAQNYQKNLLGVLVRGGWKKLSVYGSVPCSPYPSNKIIFMAHQKWGANDECFSGPVFNLPVLNFVFRSFFFFFYLVFWSCKNKGKKVVFLYALHSPHVMPLLIARFIWGLKVIVYVPDLPMYMNFGREGGRLRRTLKKLDSKFLLYACNKFDSRAVITSAMFDYVNSDDAIVVDTVVEKTVDQDAAVSIEMPGGVVFTYTGGLRDGYGVLEALEYFSQDYVKNKGWNLLLFGAGPLQGACVEYSDLHENINFYGQVPIDKARAVQSKSDFLLNLRDPFDLRFNYSYPSKITEYLASGVPVITTKVAGIPEDFYPYLNFVDLNDFDFEDLVESYQEIKKKACEGKRYLFSSRSFDRQSERLVSLIKEFWSF